MQNLMSKAPRFLRDSTAASLWHCRNRCFQDIAIWVPGKKEKPESPAFFKKT